MSDQIKPRKSLLIVDHNREAVAEALELAIANMSPADRAVWQHLPEKIRAGAVPVFIRDAGDLSAWFPSKPLVDCGAECASLQEDSPC